MSYAQIVTEDRRLAALNLLVDSGGYQASGPMLHLALGGMGHAVSLDVINADLAWLRDSALVDLKLVGDVHIAALTARGMDVAKGLTQVPGVARPGP